MPAREFPVAIGVVPAIACTVTNFFFVQQSVSKRKLHSPKKSVKGSQNQFLGWVRVARERLGEVWRVSWERLGAILGASCGVLGSSWGPLGASWGRLGGILGRLGGVLGEV